MPSSSLSSWSLCPTPTGFVDLPDMTSTQCRIVRVSGDSMSPVIRNGDYIAVRELTNLRQIFWGQIYVVILDDYRMVKYIRHHDDPALVILRSENKRYDDISVHLLSFSVALGYYFI